MDDVTRVSAAKAAWNTSSDRNPRGTQQGLFRRAFRWVVHFLSYTFILSRRDIRVSYAAGFRLSVRPTVFHPKFFISSEKFASFLDTLDLSGKRVCEIGTGTGILALAAARAGASNVVATDINPNASLSANENAQANGLGDRVTGVCMNLMAAMAPRPLFDVILSSPPKHAGEPKDLTDRGWHAGPEYRDIKEMFDQARGRLKPDGRIYLMLSSDTNQELFSSLIAKAGFSQRKIKEYSLVVESLIIFELLPR
jgi:release factor glutamine methyltransferase